MGRTYLLLASELFELERTLAGRSDGGYGAMTPDVFSVGGSKRFLIFGGGARGGPMVLVDWAKFG